MKKKKLTLNEIFCARGTDKGTYHNYGPDYEEFIDPESVETFLEIGVWTGCSMLAWHDWFPHAELWGVDLMGQPESNKSIDRIHHVVGDIAAPEIVTRIPDEFDVIIDDGSHKAKDILAAFYLLWPKVVSGGWYIVEDLFVNPELEDFLIEKAEPSESHFHKHHGEILFMRK